MSVVIVGTLDTKGEEIGFARDVIEAEGLDVHLVDVGVMDDPEIEPDTSAAVVAEAGGSSLAALREAGDRGEAVTAMGEGAVAVANRLHDDGTLDGILGLGGSGNTSIATAAMRALPIGVPKLMVSTVASGDTEPYVGCRDVAMMYSVADLEGINQLSRTVIANAALAMVGMASKQPDVDVEDRPTVAITMFGVTTPCVQTAREWLEERGYETIVFHANGTGGRAMEGLIRDGVIDAVLDVTTTEWADEVVGGCLSAGRDRLDAAAEHGLPQVVSTGALDVVNFGPRDTVPKKFRDRTLHAHNPEVTLMRTTPDEAAEIGTEIAEKLNASTGPTVLAIPRRGTSMLDSEDGPFHDPAADRALFEAMRGALNDRIECVSVDAHINSTEFAVAIASRLHDLLQDGPAD
ncbi:Tm-1-like ATP-binding domain-containing protein [Halomicroarcula sp. GCM10025817]|uniref:Tm-1-like ATP-binding domain-containing protein n=1 Tax=Halomicroarcula sp. GCM10025817 TaxID=3252672 RepID=UPI003606F576